MEDITSDDAWEERDRQRGEGEARAIIHDLNKLNTYSDDKKSRWIWELLQNAKDVATGDGVDIIVSLKKSELIFSHNGLPFRTKHLLAILYKTSTKSLDGSGGTTGKYGTGFVTTHVLNRKVAISGVHEGRSGRRGFELLIDRTVAGQDESTVLQSMQKTLDDMFQVIDKISKRPAEKVESAWHSFRYVLSAESYPYAEKGVEDLQRNLTFTLLINDRIKSVTIETETGSEQYVASPRPTSRESISFLSTTADTGILYRKAGKLTIAIPARPEGNKYVLQPLEHQAVLYKEFPLIGTENFHLPVFIQHEDFHPTEERDGIQTKKANEEDKDLTADKNRQALSEFVAAYLPFIQAVSEIAAANSYLFAQSGFPEYVERYSNIDWYQRVVQGPIRAYILQQTIVRTAAGGLSKIDAVRVPGPSLFRRDDFYTLASTFVPDLLPDSSSVWPWCEIIRQEPEGWPKGIELNEEELVKLMPGKIPPVTDSTINWLKKLYTYLDANNANHWGEKYPIYLTEAEELCVRKSVRNHPVIDPEFKYVARALGRPLEKEFLHPKLGKVSGIDEFDLKEFYEKLNNELIRAVDVHNATTEQIQAILHVCTLFKSERASRKEKWHNILQRIFPGVGERKIVSIGYENYGRSAELWSIRFICSIIGTTVTPSNFAVECFASDTDGAFEWLKDFLSYVFSMGDDGDNFLKAKIIPTEADTFVPYDDKPYAEQDLRYFDDTIKNIYGEHTIHGNPRKYIIDRRVTFEGLRTRTVEYLTGEIDKLFSAPGMADKVKKDGTHNAMFLLLNEWYEKFSPASEGFLPSFHANRNSFYVLALGDGFSSQIIAITNSGRSIEEITELAKVQLSNAQIKELDTAAGVLGADRLLRKAQEMLDAKSQVDRWRNIGTAAENAFKEAIAGLDVTCEVNNPDIGKDFELIVNAKGYSIEIKSVVEGKENVKMSILQGRTAVKEKESYALCVLTRPENEAEVVDKEYFIQHSRFVMNIGEQIGDKIKNWDQGLQTLQFNAEIHVQLEDKTESVYINRNIWRSGIPFPDFVEELKKIWLQTPVTSS